LSGAAGATKGWQIQNSGAHKDMKYILVGFDIINGTMLWEFMDKCIFVACRFQWSIRQWMNQYANLNGGADPVWGLPISGSVQAALGNNFTASPFRLAFTNGMQWHLCRWQHIGDDCVFNNGGILEFYGCDGFDNYHHNNIFYPPGGGSLTYMHNDFVQTRGGGNTKMRNCLVPSHLQLATENTGSQLLDIGTSGSPILIAGSPDGIATIDDGSNQINGSFYAKSVCNAQFLADDNGTYSTTPKYPVYAGAPDTFWEYGISGTATHMTAKQSTFGMDGAGAPPNGVSLVGGSDPVYQRIMSELKSQYDSNPSIQQHNADALMSSSDNPARAQVLAWPYSNIDQYIATQITLP